MLLLCVAVLPTSVHAQDAQSSLKSDWTFTLGAVADNNPFKLSAAEQADLQAGLQEYADMNAPADAGMLLGVDADFRTRRVHGRRMRFGFSVEGNLYGRNTARSNLSADGFVAYSFSKKDELKLEASVGPSAFRKNYVVTYDNLGTEVFARGDVTKYGLDLSYERELYDGRHGTGLELTLESGRHRRTVANMPWRDRTETRLGGQLDAQLSRRLDVELQLGWRAASHDGIPEPYGGQMLVLNRDFTSLGYGAELGWDVTKAAKLYIEYDHRDRGYDAALGEDPRYGGRSDDRDTFGSKLRLEASRTVDVWLGGAYRMDDTLRPGATTSVPDYRRAKAFFRVEYSR